MTFLFWSSFLLIFFAYAGYPLCLYFRARFWPQPAHKASCFPTVTILLAAYNEQKYLSAKLLNLAQLDYPADRLQVIVVSDGSTDETNKILADWQKFAGKFWKVQPKSVKSAVGAKPTAGQPANAPAVAKAPASRPVMTTRAPSSRNAEAIPFPMPREAPATKTTFSFSPRSI